MSNPEHLLYLRRGPEEWNNWRVMNPDVIPDLSGEDLRGIEMSGAIFINANLSDCYLYKKNFFNMEFNGADLRRANLASTDLGRVKLLGANMSGVNLVRADLREAFLDDADVTDAVVGWTTWGANDLSSVRGLETVNHVGPSTVGIDTIYSSRGTIPEAFLLGAGVPDTFITYVRSLTEQPIQFYSCFISYNSADQEFAERLHSDLQARGVRVWYAPHDLPIGALIRPAIDESIRIHDKLLLVLSGSAVGSQWVEQEVETALAMEREHGARPVLFPIRIDDSILEARGGWPAYLRNTRNIGDFSNCGDHEAYVRSLERLLRDLRAGE